MRIASEREISEIDQRLRASFGGDASRAHVAAQNLRDFQVNQMRSMQRLVGGEDESVYELRGRRLEKNLEKRGSVDDNQRPSLSARTAAAGAVRGRTGSRLESRFRISSSVGRSSAWRNSRSR
jgi:hypothetical protein